MDPDLLKSLPIPKTPKSTYYQKSSFRQFLPFTLAKTSKGIRYLTSVNNSVVAVANQRDQDEKKDNFNGQTNGNTDHPTIIFGSWNVIVVDKVDDRQNEGKDGKSGREWMEWDVLEITVKVSFE